MDTSSEKFLSNAVDLGMEQFAKALGRNWSVNVTTVDILYEETSPAVLATGLPISRALKRLRIKKNMDYLYGLNIIDQGSEEANKKLFEKLQAIWIRKLIGRAYARSKALPSATRPAV